MIYRLYYKKALEQRFRVTGDACKHNMAEDGGPFRIHFCTLQEAQKDGLLCDASSSRASECPYFDRGVEDSEIKADVKGEIDEKASQPLHIVARDMPDVAALMWVIEDDGDEESEEEIDQTLEEEIVELETENTRLNEVVISLEEQISQEKEHRRESIRELTKTAHQAFKELSALKAEHEALKEAYRAGRVEGETKGVALSDLKAMLIEVQGELSSSSPSENGIGSVDGRDDLDQSLSELMEVVESGQRMVKEAEEYLAGLPEENEERETLPAVISKPSTGAKEKPKRTLRQWFSGIWRRNAVSNGRGTEDITSPREKDEGELGEDRASVARP